MRVLKWDAPTDEEYKQGITALHNDLVIIDNCGHVPQVEKPDEFVKTALEFMA